METENKTTGIVKDKVLEDLERMLETLPESRRQPILNLIKKRKVELGMVSSDLPPAGYKLGKKKAKPKPQVQTKESRESLRRIAMSVGRIAETKEAVPHDIDFKDEPLKKDKKAIEEADSYKY